MLRQRDHNILHLGLVRKFTAVVVLPCFLDQQVAFLYIVRVAGIVAVEGEVAVDAIFHGIDGDKSLVNALSRRDGGCGRVCRDVEVVRRVRLRQQITSGGGSFSQLIQGVACQIAQRFAAGCIGRKAADDVLPTRTGVIHFQRKYCTGQRIALVAGVLHHGQAVGIVVQTAGGTGREAGTAALILRRPFAAECHFIGKGKRSARLYAIQVISDEIRDYQHERLTVRHLGPELDLRDIRIRFCVIMRGIDFAQTIYTLQAITDRICCHQRAVLLPLGFEYGNVLQRNIALLQSVGNLQLIVQLQIRAILGKLRAVRVDLDGIAQQVGAAVELAMFANHIAGDRLGKVGVLLFAVMGKGDIIDKILCGLIALAEFAFRVEGGFVGQRDLCGFSIFVLVGGFLKNDPQNRAAFCIFENTDRVIRAFYRIRMMAIEVQRYACTVQQHPGRQGIVNDPLTLGTGDHLVAVQLDGPRNLVADTDRNVTFAGHIPLGAVLDQRFPQIFHVMDRLRSTGILSVIILCDKAVVCNADPCIGAPAGCINCGGIGDGDRTFDTLFSKIDLEQSVFDVTLNFTIGLDLQLAGYIGSILIQNLDS